MMSSLYVGTQAGVWRPSGTIEIDLHIATGVSPNVLIHGHTLLHPRHLYIL